MPESWGKKAGAKGSSGMESTARAQETSWGWPQAWKLGVGQ